jgi:quinol monooxygenase YgiN
MIVIAGTITIDAARRAACLEAGVPFQEATRRDEAGCLAYVFAADPVRDDVIQVFELWDGADSLAAHFHHPNYTSMRAMFRQHAISGADVKKYRIDAVAPVYGSDGIASTDF